MREASVVLSLACVALLVACAGCSGIVVESVPSIPLLFGIDADSIPAATVNGTRPDFGEIWVGAWDLQKGWNETEKSLRTLRAENVTPFVQFYYWGDDISKDCFENGCDTAHGHKDRAGWDRLAVEFVALVDRVNPGMPMWIVVESEFNKAGLQGSSELDRALAAKVDLFHDHIPGSFVVVGFGTWADGSWFHFDDAARAADAVGLQSVHATTRESEAEYRDAPNVTLHAALKMHLLFGKPVVIHDLALSSYDGRHGLALQNSTLAAYRGLDASLRAAGVRAIVYRSFLDTPDASTNDYFGQAEKSWGLAYAYNLTAKPAAGTWNEWIRSDHALG